jgi:predicted Zn-dependent protease
MTSDYIAQLSTELAKHSEVAEFQLYSNTVHSLKAGFQNDQLGGIYQPIQDHIGQRVKYLAITKGGQMGYGSFNQFMFTSPTDAANHILANTIAVNELIPLAQPPKDFKPIKLASEVTLDIIQNQPNKVIEDISALQKQLLNSKLKSTEGQVEVQHIEQYFANSEDVYMSSSSTSYGCFADYNGELGTYESGAEYYSAIKNDNFKIVGEYATRLEDKATLPSAEYAVLLSPSLGMELLNHYLLNNTSGRTVAASIGAFSRDDFEANKQVAHKNLTISFDQTIPMNIDSFNFSADGIVGQRFDLIHNGRLCEPICNLESAKELGYTPRVVSSISTANIAAQSYQNFVKQHDKFILVLELLGIHTQNGVLGTYSLPVPAALVVENGNITSAVTGSIVGNFFDTLKQPELGFVEVPGFPKPGLSFTTKFES